jgi:hypothetical protein
MKNPLRVLVVEDNPQHTAQLMSMLDQEVPKLPIKIFVIVVADLQMAQREYPNMDAVITDVFFPEVLGGDSEVPNGKVIVERCLADQKPVVWITSTYHHGKKTNAVNEWGRAHGLEMFDCGDYNIEDGEAIHKPWKDALYGLLYSIVGIETGNYSIQDGKMVAVNQDVPRRVSIYSIDPFMQKPTRDFIPDPVIEEMVKQGFKIADS